ncbi:hypothetical protein M514_11147 [Trichuris suis]|uniref:Tudor domain-containing protein n=1 Tax=Trichuris suis TaxID=68888 RepID=A0A085N8D0_9BILA|nr:hypothetical protein M513_11147 [Trichuris suis]KFD65726.1 hypothetical protein M514_11147 [Trichuris suis]KHJ43690.1 tudor domain protein [Trichuris suis]
MKALSDTETSRTASKCSLCEEKNDECDENVLTKPRKAKRNTQRELAKSDAPISTDSILGSVRLLKESEDKFSLNQTCPQPPYGDILCDSISLYYPTMQLRKGEIIEGRIVSRAVGKKFTFLIHSLEANAAYANEQLHTLYEMNPQYPLLRDLNICYYGMPCAARTAQSNEWKRARILKTTKSGNHCVLFVDSGLIEKVSYKNTKPLVAKYTNIAKPATIRCKVIGDMSPQILEKQQINLTVIKNGKVVYVKVTKKERANAILEKNEAD